MLISDLDKLAALIRRERDGLLSRWREPAQLNGLALQGEPFHILNGSAQPPSPGAGGPGAQRRRRACPDVQDPARRNVQHLAGLVGKVIEENTGLLSELGIKLERRTFDLWPLVEALVHFTLPPRQSAAAVEIS